MLYKFLLILISFIIILACSESDTTDDAYVTEIVSTSSPLPAITLQEDIKEGAKVELPIEIIDENKFIMNPEPTTTSEYELFTQRIKEIKMTESKSIYDLENEYYTPNRLIELGWNKPTEKSPEFTITDDLNEEALNSVKKGVIIATEYLGNYGPLKVFIIGSDIDKAKIVAKEFCEWAYVDKVMIEHCIDKDQGIGIVEMAIYKGNNGFAQHSREIENPNQSFVMGNPDKYSVKISIHEYVHIYQNAHIVDGWWNDKEDDAGLPRWLEEGSAELLAMYLVGDYANYLSESLKIAKNFKKDNPYISIRNLENENDLRILENKDCLGGHCIGTLQYETGTVATALLINQTSMDYFYKEYIPKIAYLGGEKAFETSFNITINEFHEIFDSFLDLSVDEMMNFLNKYQE